MFIYVAYNRSKEQEKLFPMLVNHPRDATKQFQLSPNSNDVKMPDLNTGEITLSCWTYLKDAEFSGSNHIISIGQSIENNFEPAAPKLSYFHLTMIILIIYMYM